MSTSLTRIMVVSISLCWLLSAKTHLNDIVDPSVAEKLAHEAMLQEKAAKDEVKAPKKENQGKDIEIVLPVQGKTFAKPSMQDPSESLDLNNQDKINYYNRLKEGHEASPVLHQFINDPIYTGENGKVYRQSEAELSRDGDVGATVCADSYSSEVGWILLDTANWWTWGSDGWVQHSAGNNACEDWSVTVPDGNYMFILGDSYGDGGATADISLNGELLASIATASGDPMGQGGYYEAQFVLDVTAPEPPCFDTDNGATDAYGDSCAGYTTFPSWCGGYDDDDFNSAEMCCACGGGTSEAPPTVVTFDIDGVEDCGFVSVTGTWDNFSGWGAHTDNGMAATVPAGDHEFVILCVDTASNAEWYNDIWGNSTVINAPIDGECWNGNYEYANYAFTTAGESTMTIAYCAGSCDAACAVACEGTEYIMSVGGGSWDSEISWELSDGSSGGAPFTGTVCLSDGDYVLTMIDSYGDGWNGASFTLSDADGNLYASCGLETGLTADCSFTLDGTPLAGGCTDPGAPNYDPYAVVDDGSCEAYCGGPDECAIYLGLGYTCEQLEYYGYDCSACEADGTCADTSHTCADGVVVDDPSECEGCAYDMSQFGAASCDAAWDSFGVSCADLESNYGWDCLGCSCPGDVAPPSCDEQWQGCLASLADYDYYNGTTWATECAECAETCAQNPEVPMLTSACMDAAYNIGAGSCPDPCGGSADDGGDDGGNDLCYGLVVAMFDSWGDGWNGDVLTIGSQTFTLDTGLSGTDCYEGPYDVPVTVGGGSYPSEVSWQLYDWMGTVVLEGGSPYQGCLGNCGDGLYGCTDETACNYDPDAENDDGSCLQNDCTGECGGTAVEDCAGECNGPAVADDCGECNGDGSACAGCAYPTWYDDQYCDAANNTPECGYDGGDCCPGDCPEGGLNNPGSYTCEANGGTCATCIDPDSADNADGGQCTDYVGGCTDPYADNYDPTATEDDGTCLYNGCAAGTIAGCSEQDLAAGECVLEAWVGDGYCDGYAEAYGVNLCCYDLDGGDCSAAECEVPDGDWDSSITGLTATGVDFTDPYTGVTAPAILWDWDDVSDGDDTPVLTCEEQWGACLVSLAVYDYYNGTTWATECAECADTCAQNPDVPELTDECMAAAYNIGAGTCPDPCADTGPVTCADGSDPLVDCVGTEFCNEDCVSENYDGCVTGENTWLGDDYCDDGTWDLVFACAEYDCDGCDCAGEGGGFSTDGCSADCDYTAPDNAACAESLVISTGLNDFDGDGYADECFTDGTAYLAFDWTGGCLVTAVAGAGYDQDGPCDEDTGVGCDFAAGDAEDFTALGFTGGFYWYGWEANVSDYWTVTFGDVSVGAEATTGDCTPDVTEGCSDTQFDCLGDGTECIPLSYFCDGSIEFCNAGWPADCSNGADEGLETCGYTDDCDSGDDGAADDGGDGGGEACVNDDSTSDAYGDTCSSWYDDYESPGSMGCTGAYDDDDFIASEQCCACQGARDSQSDDLANTIPGISTDKKVNLKLRAEAITHYKKTSREKAAPVGKVFHGEKTDKTIAFIDRTGEITYIANGPSEDRLVTGYTIAVSCDACIAGGPAEGEFQSDVSEITIYGFDAGSTACATVQASSSIYGLGDISDSVCAEAGSGDPSGCEFFDCEGQEACGYESWVGDGYCDDGTWGYYFNCEEFDCDAGDCLDECGECNGDGSSCACTAGDVNEDDDLNVQDIVVMVGYILDGSNADVVESCGDTNADGSVNVQDIVVLVNYILGGRTTSDATEARLNINDGIASLDANGFVGAVQMTLSHEAGFSIELTNKAMVADYRTNGNSTTLIIVAPDSDELFTASGSFNVEEVIVANENSQVTVMMPSELTLSKAYPNPFNPSTSMNIYVPADGIVSLSVYNVMGQEVATLHSGNMSAGNHTVTWNASNMTSGMYFVRAESQAGVAVQKVMLMK